MRYTPDNAFARTVVPETGLDPKDRCKWLGCKASVVAEIDLCDIHFARIGELYIEKRSIWGAAALRESLASREREEAARKQRDLAAERDAWARSRSVVYYVRIGDHIKIGYTVNFRERLSGLRVDTSSVLAVEPGWREREAERHAMFAEERQGRRENFNPSRRLVAHAAAIRHKYGEPIAFAQRRRDQAGTMPI